jgi:hypothetical protein
MIRERGFCGVNGTSSGILADDYGNTIFDGNDSTGTLTLYAD